MENSLTAELKAFLAWVSSAEEIGPIKSWKTNLAGNFLDGKTFAHKTSSSSVPAEVRRFFIVIGNLAPPFHPLRNISRRGTATGLSFPAGDVWLISVLIFPSHLFFLWKSFSFQFGLSIIFPPSSTSSQFLFQALARLYFCLKLAWRPISTSIYVAFTSHETAVGGLRNYLATKPRAPLFHCSSLEKVRLCTAQCISGGVCGG